jgi:hypothetical protein
MGEKLRRFWVIKEEWSLIGIKIIMEPYDWMCEKT